MAELLVKAENHWMDSLTIDEVNALDASAREHYDARSQKGDIVVVKPDGWQWGKEECPPRFIVVKIPGMSVEDARQYAEPLVEEIGIDEKTHLTRYRMIRYRKHAINQSEVDKAIVAKNKSIEYRDDRELSNNTIAKQGLASEVSQPLSAEEI